VSKLEEFLKQYHVRRYPKGEIIVTQGEVPSCGYVIKKGVIKTYNLTSQGEEKPITFDTEGDALPIGWIFGKVKFAIYFYEAFTDCELYCIPRQDYMDYIKQNPEVMFEEFDRFMSRYLNNHLRVNALEQSKAAEKVVNTIHYLCLRFGKDLKPDLVQIQLPLTQQDLANFMGLTRETTGIELKKLQRRGILTYKKQNYQVHTNRLNELLDEEYELGGLKSGGIDEANFN
jgi:CRP/FNR family transcriptional regulator, anaerobic regulatory protein